jgi:hypothetical protein
MPTSIRYTVERSGDIIFRFGVRAYVATVLIVLVQFYTKFAFMSFSRSSNRFYICMYHRSCFRQNRDVMTHSKDENNGFRVIETVYFAKCSRKFTSRALRANLL